ncbi:right-handed parallel beta-helix repeat-containing protein [bacterium]|nr:right-handed parallel beta-helix repeat-containing protein [bacterium]
MYHTYSETRFTAIWILLVFSWLTAGLCHASTIHIASFGATPDDGKDDTAAINAALATAGSDDIVVFGLGVYDLITPCNEDHHLRLYDKTNVTLRGAVSDGEPATRLLRHVNLEQRETLPQIISIRYSKNITFENFILDNSPRHCTAGRVVQKDSEGKWIRVQIFDGLPMDEGVGCSSANAWESIEPRVLKRVPSLTYGTSPGNWTIHDAENRIMELRNPEGLSFIDNIDVNEFMSWHYGAAGKNQLDFWEIDGLTLRNLWIPNSINAITNIVYSKDVALEHIRVAPEGGHLTVGPRDAFHLSSNGGYMIIDDVDIEGVRWDPIVFRSRYAIIADKTDATHFRIEAKAQVRDIPAGSTLGLWSSTGDLEFVEVGSAMWSSSPTKGFDIVTTEPIPTWAGLGTELKISAHMPVRVSITNCDFRNNAGVDVILFTDNAVLSNNTHFRTMYPAIYLGSNNSSAGICGSHIRILNSTFTECGWENKNGVSGVIAMDNVNVCQTAKIFDLDIQGNTFKNINIGPAIYLRDLDTCDISNNTFTNVLATVEMDEGTTANVNIHDNRDGDMAKAQIWPESEIYHVGKPTPGR